MEQGRRGPSEAREFYKKGPQCRMEQIRATTHFKPERKEKGSSSSSSPSLTSLNKTIFLLSSPSSSLCALSTFTFSSPSFLFPLLFLLFPPLVHICPPSKHLYYFLNNHAVTLALKNKMSRTNVTLWI